MPRFIVDETQAVWVTWSREVEAPTLEDAMECVKRPEIQRPGCREIFTPENMEPIIGESLDGFEITYCGEELGPEECL